MNTHHTTKLGLAAAAAALATGGLVAAAGPGAADGPDAHRPDGQGAGQPAARTSAATVGAVSCNGGRSISLQSKIVSQPFTFSYAGGADQDIPGTAITLRGPRRGADTYLITYSAETRLTTSGSGWMGLEAHVDGTPVVPYSSGADPLAISSADAYGSNSAQFCVRLGRGTHRLQMKTNIVGSTNTGWLDDYTTSVQRFR